MLSRAAPNYNLLSLVVNIPTQLTPLSASTCNLSTSGAVCSLASSQEYHISSFSDFSSQLVMSFSATASFFAQTSPLVITLSYNGKVVATNSAVTIVAYCLTPCQQCTASSAAQCLSCLPTPYTTFTTLFPANSSCVTACPDTYFSSGGQCSSCNQSACYSCVTTLNTCTSCPAAKYLLNSECLGVCPTLYYPSVAANNSHSGQCLVCQSTCVTCSSSSLCLTCISSYFLDLDSRCVLECTSPGYLGIEGTCKLCINNCKTCVGSLSNCSSCD